MRLRVRPLVLCVVAALAGCNTAGTTINVRYSDAQRQFFSTLASLPDDRVAVAGISSAASTHNDPTSWDGIVGVFSSQGYPHFIHTASSVGLDQFTDVEVLENNLIIVAGTYSGPLVIDGIEIPHEGTTTAGLVLAFEFDGSLRWFRTFTAHSPASADRLALSNNRILVSVRVETADALISDGGVLADSSQSLTPATHLVELSRNNEVLSTTTLELDGVVYDIEPTESGWLLGGVFTGAYSSGPVHIVSDLDGNDGFVLSLDESFHPRWAISVKGAELTPVVTLLPLDPATGEVAIAGHFTNEVTLAGSLFTAPSAERATYVAVLRADHTVGRVITLVSPTFASPYEMVADPKALGDFDLVGEFHNYLRSTDYVAQVSSRDFVDGYQLHVSATGAVVLHSSNRPGFDTYFAATRTQDGGLLCGGERYWGPPTESTLTARVHGDGWAHAPC